MSNFCLFFIFLARTAKRIVDRVSQESDSSEEQVVIMLVLEEPLRESFRMRVNFELR